MVHVVLHPMQGPLSRANLNAGGIVFYAYTAKQKRPIAPLATASIALLSGLFASAKRTKVPVAQRKVIRIIGKNAFVLSRRTPAAPVFFFFK